MELTITNENTSAGSSGTIKLLDMPASPVIEEYQSEIIIEGTQSVIEEGQVYQDKQTIATTMKHYSVMHKYQFRVKRSRHRSYWLICVGENCNWHFKATSINDPAMFKVRSFNRQHTCTLMEDIFIQRKCTAVVVGSMIIPKQVVAVDGTFLKSVYRGIMLTTSTMDAASTILPLAYAVVDSENDASWKWFFKQFKQAYGERTSMCIVSDRNESILKATSIVYLGLPHYSCMWHIWTNIRAKLKKGHLKLNELYFATARSYTLDEFNEWMSKIEEIDPRVKSYLYDIGYHRWSRVHATVNRTWTMTSNITESLNAVTKYARELSIFDLLEYMRTLLERWTNEKLLKAKGTFTFLGSKFNKELENNRTLSQKLRVSASTDHIHTVIDGVKRYIVCLESKKCSCGKFQLDELPCAHALATLRHRNETYENYCSPYYTKESLLHMYEIPVNPLPDESKWNVSQHIFDEVVNPPTGEKRQPGRPQKERYKTYDELKSKKYKVSCDNCGASTSIF
uniref:SWIM-type domain-containing protein n=1 Tax=Nicotiana tabacum TaxID=4097 RepID=A0A1S3Z254_TOBAC|nr:PREDICTED: uncharacterized protein LOC107782161 [Nicotiana tabacum]